MQRGLVGSEMCIRDRFGALMEFQEVFKTYGIELDSPKLLDFYPRCRRHKHLGMGKNIDVGVLREIAITELRPRYKLDSLKYRNIKRSMKKIVTFRNAVVHSEPIPLDFKLRSCTIMIDVLSQLLNRSPAHPQFAKLQSRIDEIMSIISAKPTITKPVEKPKGCTIIPREKLESFLLEQKIKLKKQKKFQQHNFPCTLR
eukprot:TRINITY_DN10689_c0_g2_i4.p1 TRINITY_DN10689_c0_g2~~TRINITY_DN10689_c0_g2_i4.p1  ORF type:complete len:199 (-),score=29.88 TRINITY_DN10689_c0_g2_i4:10-606(-)